MKPIARDSSNYVGIREKGRIYIDKTSWLHKMITDPCGTLFFISRPRRFGKSLMISTLKAIFQGRRELFEGLDIAKTDYDWAVHPVIHLNMGFCARPTAELFEKAFPYEIQRGLAECGVEYDFSLDPAGNLGRALDELAARGARPVVLIDEYDDPVAKVLAKPDEAEAVRSMLSSIYGQLKDRVDNLRFVMITGVSKFTKMSIFSALSNLVDLSFNDEYATMLGFTEGELDEYYGEYMSAHASKMGLSMEAYRAELRRMYNGYRFWRFSGENVYNPVSINLTMCGMSPSFEYNWANTGRASMLMNFLKREEILSVDPEKVKAFPQEFDVTDLDHIPLKGLLYQTGYLTIKDYNPYTKMYILGLPDEEVRTDFAVVMASACANKGGTWVSELGTQLLLGEWERFFAGLKSLYAGVAYGPKEARVCEYSYGRCLSFLLQGLGIVCQPEVTQANGRVDMVCTHPCGIWVFELKVDQPAAIAMEQIERKHYADAYAADGRPVWLVGLSFCSETRQLLEGACERYR